MEEFSQSFSVAFDGVLAVSVDSEQYIQRQNIIEENTKGSYDCQCQQGGGNSGGCKAQKDREVTRTIEIRKDEYYYPCVIAGSAKPLYGSTFSSKTSRQSAILPQIRAEL